MAEADGKTLSWYSSNQRAIMPLDHRFRYPKSLRRVLNQKRFTPTINRSFEAVVDGCADRETTWISPQLKEIYMRLHRAGYAHSFETWQGNELAGGFLGICLGGVFIGESMFYRIPEGSKAGMVLLVDHLRSRKFALFDVQILNPHLARFGAFEIDKSVYEATLYDAIQHSCQFN